MSAATDKVIYEIDHYLRVMKENGKKPDNLFLTRKQYNDLRQGVKDTNQWVQVSGEKPTYRGYPIEVSE